VTIASHAESAFPLEGAHRAVACSACHLAFGAGSPIAGEATLVSAVHGWDLIEFTRVTGTTCAACHEDPHRGQFADRASEGRCEACHTSDGFDNAPRFDHDRDAAFPLAGSHADVACDQCHRAPASGDTAGTVYAPLPHQCEDCHTAAVGSRTP
jgi:hypothetical protein